MKKRTWFALILALLMTLTACDLGSGFSIYDGDNDTHRSSKKSASSGKGNVVIEVTSITGIEGEAESEQVGNLTDRDLMTDWHIDEFNGACAIWSYEKALEVTGYTMVTGKDASYKPDYNPTGWTLYGCNGDTAPEQDDEAWQVIDEVQNDTALKETSRTATHYDAAAEEEFQHYMLKIHTVKGNTTMQLSEFALEYKNANLSFIEKNEFVPGNFAGSSYVSDGLEYELAVGDEWTMYNPLQAWSTYYAYTWIAIEGDELVTFDRSGPTCRVMALKEGEVTIEAKLIQTSVIGFYCNSYEDTRTFTIKIVEKTGTDDPHHGDVSNGACPRCQGRLTVSCTACYGDGKLTGGTPCTGCDNGKIPCTYCKGSGMWKN